jgi:hypothetical protein
MPGVRLTLLGLVDESEHAASFSVRVVLVLPPDSLAGMRTLGTFAAVAAVIQLLSAALMLLCASQSAPRR